MPPILASILTIALIVYLLRRDIREKPNVTGAIWLPVLWMFIIASRPVSAWFTIVGVPMAGAITVEEGSPVDSVAFFVLITGGLYVLWKRQVSLTEVVRDNAWLTVFVLYCLVAVLWSDFPFVSFKRWIKILGHPIMVLVVLTDPEPQEALLRLMKRCAYVVLPVSVLWIKYYPRLGRDFSDWGGAANCGIAGGKNLLGCDCLVLGLFFFWYILQLLQTKKSRLRRKELWVTVCLIWIIGYLLLKSDSSTSTICLLLGAVIMLFFGLKLVRHAPGVYAVIVAATMVLAQLVFNIYGYIVGLSGHDSTIEGRGQLWRTLLTTDTHPIFGTGFESFWLGNRLQRLWQEYWWHPTQAHNGYIEIYLNLGLVGVVILLLLLLATFRKCWSSMLTDFEVGRLRVAFLLVFVVYNWTEAAFKALHFGFFAFYIVAMDYGLRTKWSGLRPSPRSEDLKFVSDARVGSHDLYDDVPTFNNSETALLRKATNSGERENS